MSAIGTSELESILDRLGYPQHHRRGFVRPPGCADTLDFVAYSQQHLQDLGTSAIAAVLLKPSLDHARALDLARRAGAPFALLGESVSISVFRVGSTVDGDTKIEDIDPVDGGGPSDQLVRSLGPREIEEAKLGVRQLPLFPIDVNLLDVARDASAGSLTDRVEEVFSEAQSIGSLSGVEVAQAVAGSLGVVIVKDKYGMPINEPAALIDAALQRHRDYFSPLAIIESKAPTIVHTIIRELSEGIDYSAVDARTVNRVYEGLAVTESLRRDLGIFYTPQHFADRIMMMLPIEEIDPEARFVLDPACGSGNLLLAATERLKRTAPAGWDPLSTHNWLNTHVMGCDVERVAVEIARLSFLVSSLPLGNSWQVQQRDVLTDPPEIRPSLIVSNPPWRSAKGKRDERANHFVARSLELLTDGGFLACVLPATWLSSNTAAAARQRLHDECEVFEVWRLPRDVFEQARFSTSVVFARKGRSSKRSVYSYRWVGPGRPEIKSFLDDGKVTYSALADLPQTGSKLTSGPLTRRTDWGTLETIADFVSGVVQRTGATFRTQGKHRALPRGTRYQPYKELPSEVTQWVNSGADFGVGNRDLSPFTPNQVLVQASRNPDTAWRIRPVLDPMGVAPANSWHSIVPRSLNRDEALAILALLAASTPSLWIHSSVATMRIPIDAFRTIPIPTPWSEWRERFSELGDLLVRPEVEPEVYSRLEQLAAEAYALTPAELAASARLMGNSQAPEGALRRLPGDSQMMVRTTEGNQHDQDFEPASVLSISGGRLRIWRLSGPEQGELTDLPTRLPGWCAKEGSVFEVAGEDLLEARYRFHRSSYVPEATLFGVG